MDKFNVTDIPPWIRHFLVHVVKRCANILVKWIEDMQKAGGG